MEEFKPFKIERPWGNFQQYTHNTPSTVKILFIAKGEAFSLQYHNKRTEFWKILSGTPEITMGENVIRAKKGDEFMVQSKVNHRIHSVDMDTEVLEIAFGDFDEGDIMRIEDKYGRA